MQQLPKATEALKNYKEIYLSGHSLGGYLAMFYGGTQVFSDPRFKHGAVFNAPGIHKSLLSSSQLLRTAQDNAVVLTNDSYTVSPDKRIENNEKKMQSYGIHGDIAGGLYAYPNTRWTDSAMTKSMNKHSSGQFFADKGSKNFEKWFTTGYHMGTFPTDSDSDHDGFSDGIEVAVGSILHQTHKVVHH